MSVMFDHRASWHWLVPDENEPEHATRVWACAPERRAAWHVRNDRSHPDVNHGSKNVNYWSLGVEIVNTQSAQVSDPFSGLASKASCGTGQVCVERTRTR